jgi:hypothetical protein
MMFDYAFYSLYNLYLEKEGKNSNPTLSSMQAVAALEICLLFGISILFNFFITIDAELEEILGISDTNIKILLIIFLLFWEYFSYKSYKKRLPEIIKKYKNHPRNKWFRAWMLYFVALGFILIPILIV